jgi:adenylosuccinate synthase
LMLSMFFGTYPYVTSRDTSASSVCAEAGVGPTKVDRVIVVYKAFMTRVGAGNLPGELPKEESVKRGWFEIAATGRERRAAPFDFDLAKRSAMISGATEAAITKLDILFPTCKNATSFERLPSEAKEFITRIESSIGAPVTVIGTGPSVFDIIDRRK